MCTCNGGIINTVFPVVRAYEWRNSFSCWCSLIRPCESVCASSSSVCVCLRLSIMYLLRVFIFLVNVRSLNTDMNGGESAWMQENMKKGVRWSMLQGK